jgi:hypothetical protein
MRLAFDEMPPHAVACGREAVLAQRRIILSRMRVVPGGGDQVKPPTIVTAVRRAFEAAEKKALQRHVPSLIKSSTARTAFDEASFLSGATVRFRHSALQSCRVGALSCMERQSRVCVFPSCCR